MSQQQMQYSFHAGELTPALLARVDIAKYKAGASLMLNLYPDYRGGCSSRSGTKFVMKCNSPNSRLIPFQQSSTTANYILEFGQGYIRFIFQGAPITESPITVSAMTNASPGVFTTSAPHGFSPGDMVVFGSVVPSNNGIASNVTPTGGRTGIIGSTPSTTTFTMQDYFNASWNTTTYGGLTSATVSRVYTIASPYQAADLPLLKFAQNANTLLLTHNNYSPRLLTLVSFNNWLLSPLVIGSTIQPPTVGAPSSTLAAGTVNYAYAVTAVDSAGQESIISTIVQLNSLQDIRSVAGSNVITWVAQLGATSYNVYRAEPSYAGVVPTGAAFGFVGNATGTSFIDSNIAPDFAQSPPTVQNPFVGQSVISYTVNTVGAYTSAPIVNVGAPFAGGGQATANALLGVTGATLSAGGAGYTVGQIVTMADPNDPSFPNVVQLQVLTVSGSAVATFSVFRDISYYGPGQTLPTVLQDNQGGGFTVGTLTWGVEQIVPLSIGSGYLSAPTVTIVPGGATATAVLSTGPSTANPGTCVYFQQRLVMGAPAANPQEFNMSQTGAYFNYNVSNPVVASDAIQGALVSNQLNSIKSMASMSTGLIVITDKAAWLMNGGSIGSPVTPSQIVATQHSYIGGNDMPPIVINYDILYVQAKGSIVRDLTYNFYAQIYTGTDISILSSHLFYGYKMLQWAYAEEPFKVIWIVRSDGQLVSLTYLKEQEIIGWAHHNTGPGGLHKFTSVATITEPSPLFTNTIQTVKGLANVDAIYVIVQRTIFNQTVYYIERMMDRLFTSPTAPLPTRNVAWCLDCGGQYSGSPPGVITGVDWLKGTTISGISDGIPFTAAVAGNPGPPSMTIPNPPGGGHIVTFGLPFTCQLQTLPIDTGEPTTQGKRKKVTAVTVRVQDTLGLQIGRTFQTLVPMSDLIVGNINVPGQYVVGDLVTGDARTIIDPSWDSISQYCIQQSNPWPVTILGVIPELVVGDTPPGK